MRLPERTETSSASSVGAPRRTVAVTARRVVFAFRRGFGGDERVGARTLGA